MKAKLRAFFYHLALSIVLLSSVFFLVSSMWYPEFMYLLDGAWEGSKVILLVDLILGPALTFLIYKKGKKGLYFDLAVIGLLQVLALLYGVYLLYAYRPVALIFTGSEYVSVTADVYNNYSATMPPNSSSRSKQLCGFSCYLLSNDSESSQSVLQSGVPARVSYKFYLDYADHWNSSVRAVDLNDKTQFSEKSRNLVYANLSDVAEKAELETRQLVVLKARGRYLDGFVFVERTSGNILEFMARPLLVE